MKKKLLKQVKKVMNNKNKKKKTKVKQFKRERTSVLESLGGQIGSVFGPLGASAGSVAGKLISRITGFGDYKVNSNTVLSNSAPPSFTSNGDGMHISHREFIGDISGSTAFSLGTLPVNPAFPATFPWLSQIAAYFEEYKFLGLVFEFRPTSGSAVSSTSSALGVVVYATNYDAASPSFTSKQQMESYEYSSSCVPFNQMIHPVECAPNRNPTCTLYTRTTTPPAGTDIRLYDLGNFQYATVGMQSAYAVGELWVSYHVALYKPRISVPLDASVLSAHIRESAATTAAAGALLGTSGGAVDPDSTLQISLITNNSFTIVRPGVYSVACNWVGSTIAALPVLTVTSGGTKLTILNDNASNGNAIYGTTNAALVCVVSVTGALGALITLSGLTGMASATCDIIITQYNSLVNLYNPHRSGKVITMDSLQRTQLERKTTGLTTISEDYVGIERCRI